MSTTLWQCLCDLKVRMYISFTNCTEKNVACPGQTLARVADVEFEELVAKWKTWIQDFWNGPDGYRPWGACRVRFEVVTPRSRNLVPNMLRSRFHMIDVVGYHGASFCGIGPTSQTGEWDQYDDEYVVAHEAGHLMGLPIVCPEDQNLSCDEYNLPQGTCTIEAGQANCIMMSTDPPVDVPPEHVDEIVRGLGGTCGRMCWILGRFRSRSTAPILAFPGHPSGPVPPDQRPKHFEDPPKSSWALDQLLTRAETGRVIDLFAALRATEEKLTKDDSAVQGLIDALNHRSVLRRWLAAVALGRVRDDAAHAALLRALNDEDVNIRVRAAASLVQRKDLRGVPALLAALRVTDPIIGHPPERVSAHAGHLLRVISGEDVGFDAHAEEDERDEAIGRWQAWWESRERGGTKGR